jgi:hypothetical protein
MLFPPDGSQEADINTFGIEKIPATNTKYRITWATPLAFPKGELYLIDLNVVFQ